MLYGEQTPLVEVGLVYKPQYISTEPFSATYMHLHVWHAAGSSVESRDKLNSSHLIFVSVSEMSYMIPVATHANNLFFLSFWWNVCESFAGFPTSSEVCTCFGEWL